MELSPLEFMLKSFPGTLQEQGMRRILGVFGCSGNYCFSSFPWCACSFLFVRACVCILFVLFLVKSFVRACWQV